MTSILEIQTAIYNKLVNDSTLMSKVTGVFDEVNENQPFPYIVIDGIKESLNNTFGRNGYECYATLHIWSIKPGFKESIGILDNINQLLDGADLEMLNFDCIVCQYDSGETLRDDNSDRYIAVTYHVKVAQK